MHFSTKNYLKNTRNHIVKHAPHPHPHPHPQVLDFKNGWVEIQYKIEWWGVLSELGENPNPHDDKSSSALLQEVMSNFTSNSLLVSHFHPSILFLLRFMRNFGLPVLHSSLSSTKANFFFALPHRIVNAVKRVLMVTTVPMAQINF